MKSLIDKAILSFSALFLAVSFFLEYGVGLNPCPLCLMQRFSLMVIVFFFAVYVFVKQIRGSRFCFALGAIFVVTGLYFAARHVWITLSPDNAHSCLPALSFMIENEFPASEIIKAIFLGSADCAKIDWHFLGLSLPVWSLLGFLWLFILLVARVCIGYKQAKD